MPHPPHTCRIETNHVCIKMSVIAKLLSCQKNDKSSRECHIVGITDGHCVTITIAVGIELGLCIFYASGESEGRHFVSVSIH